MNVAHAHHMLLYGCTKPGSSREVWDCGEMGTNRQRELKRASPCSKGSQVIYSWARDAPPLDLPDGVAFKVGGSTRIQYLVLQIHYTDVSSFTEEGKTDDSGVALHYTKTPQPKAAGVFLLGTSGYIGPKQTEFMESAYTIKENKVIHPFAYLTHTRSLGRLVSGYRVRRNVQTGKDEWTLIGKKNPMLPQMFYPAENNMTIIKGDTVASRCTMVSNRNRITNIGAAVEDEICNFHIMYWMKGAESLNPKYCFTRGPPHYYWNNNKSVNHWSPSLNNIPIPDIEAFSI